MALRAVYGVGDETEGEMVYLVRTRMDGSVEHDWMPASVAVAEVGYHQENGSLYRSARIVADDVNMGAWDRSG